MSQDEVYNTFYTAIIFGGSFYKKLGEAGILADAENKSLILKTWPRMVTQYGPNSSMYCNESGTPLAVKK